MNILKSRAAPPFISVSTPRSEPRPAPIYQESWKLRRYVGFVNVTTNTVDLQITLSSIKTSVGANGTDFGPLAYSLIKSITIWAPTAESTGTSVVLNSKPLVVSCLTANVSSLGADPVTAVDMGSAVSRPAVRFNIPDISTKMVDGPAATLLSITKDAIVLGYYTVEIVAYARI